MHLSSRVPLGFVLALLIFILLATWMLNGKNTSKVHGNIVETEVATAGQRTAY